MAYQFSNRKRPSESDHDQNRNILSSGPASVPNSTMLSAIDAGVIQRSMPNSAMQALQNQRPAAEQEADRLSAGVTSTTPAALRREMGERLGADFSDVRFHNNTQSSAKADSIGARAFTKGNDIYFGEGGFNSRVAAHELVHTVQQGVVKGEVGQSVPEGSVQMWPWWPFNRRKKNVPRNKEEKNFKDLERLYRIQAGLSTGNPRLVSKKDRKWYEKKMKDSDPRLVQEILRRRDAKSIELMNHRRRLGENNPENKSDEELNYQARNSSAAFDMNIYHMLALKAEDDRLSYYIAQRKHNKKQNRETADTVRDAFALMRDRAFNRNGETVDEAFDRKQNYREISEQIYKNSNMYVDYSSDRGQLSKHWNLVDNDENNEAAIVDERSIKKGGFGPGAPAQFSANEEAEANDFLGAGNNGAFENWRGGLKAREELALIDYTKENGKGNYKQFNKPLRENAPMSENIHQRLDAINDAMNRYDLPGDMIVYRGVGPEMFGNLTDAAKIKQLYAGKVVRDRGFVSTSTVEGRQFNRPMIQLKIRIPKGKARGAYVSPFSRFPNETEFVLKNGSAFRVTDAYHSVVDNKIWVEMDLIT